MLVCRSVELCSLVSTEILAFQKILTEGRFINLTLSMGQMLHWSLPKWSSQEVFKQMLEGDKVTGAQVVPKIQEDAQRKDF